MRVAIPVFGGKGWTGGTQYLINLLSAIRYLPANPLEPVLFSGLGDENEISGEMSTYLSIASVQSGLWNRGSFAFRKRIINSIIFQRDTAAEKTFQKAGVDVVFQLNAWYGFRFGLPTLVWLPDFQHRNLPQMFGKIRSWKRDLLFRALIKSATRILVSSEDARHDCEEFYPLSKGKIAVLPFVVRIDSHALGENPDAVRRKYNLPKKYFFLPNQFWKHKNHLGIIEALRILKKRGEDKITVGVSGNPRDHRNPDHPGLVVSSAERYGLSEQFRILGMIPRADILPLMRASVAVINPSFFEGWSTTVEEAKSLGIPMLLSDLRVHREQSPDVCSYFDPHDPFEIADALKLAWCEWEPGPRFDLEDTALKKTALRREQFARLFCEIVEETANGFMKKCSGSS